MATRAKKTVEADLARVVEPAFLFGDMVRKKKGAEWSGIVVGTYSTSLTPEGYAVESSTHKGSVQIYPVAALELVAASIPEEPQEPAAPAWVAGSAA